MTKIRLKRQGSKFNVHYKVIVADARAPRDGRFIDVVGYYNPHTKELNLDKPLIMKWLSEGAVPTETVKALFKKQKINEEFAKTKTSKKPAAKKSAAKKPAAKKSAAKKPAAKPAAKESK